MTELIPPSERRLVDAASIVADLIIAAEEEATTGDGAVLRIRSIEATRRVTDDPDLGAVLLVYVARLLAAHRAAATS